MNLEMIIGINLILIIFVIILKREKKERLELITLFPIKKSNVEFIEIENKFKNSNNCATDKHL